MGVDGQMSVEYLMCHMRGFHRNGVTMVKI